MAQLDDFSRDTTPTRRLGPVAVFAIAGFAVVGARMLTNSLDTIPALSIWIPVLAGLGTVAIVISIGWWTPAWPEERADQLGRLTWTMSRLIAMALSVLLIVAAVSYQPPLPSCPENLPGTSGGELMYSSVSGNTLNCKYEDRGGSL